MPNWIFLFPIITSMTLCTSPHPLQAPPQQYSHFSSDPYLSVFSVGRETVKPSNSESNSESNCESLSGDQHRLHSAGQVGSALHDHIQYHASSCLSLQQLLVLLKEVCKPSEGNVATHTICALWFSGAGVAMELVVWWWRCTPLLLIRTTSSLSMPFLPCYVPQLVG